MNEFIQNRIINPLRKNKVLAVIAFVLFFIGCRFGELYRLSGKSLVIFIENMDYLYRTIPRFQLQDVKTGAALVAILIFFYIIRSLQRKI